MAKPDPSIDPRILESAKIEFLACGFEKASLQVICEHAGITTGALYKRYKGKEDLFCAVVADTIADLDSEVEKRCTVEVSELSDKDLIMAWDMSDADEAAMMWWFRFLYARHEGFVLLLTCADGTRYFNFQHDWVEKMTEKSYEYFLEAYKRGLTHVEVSRAELHVILSAFWTSIYEPFIHNFTWPQIEAHCRLVCKFFNWQAVFGFPSIP